MTSRKKILVHFPIDSGLRGRLDRFSDRIELIGSDTLQAGDRTDVEDIEIIFGNFLLGELARWRSLRWIQLKSAGGVEEYWSPEFVEKGIVLTTTRGVQAPALTEHLFGMILMHTRRLALAWDSQQERRWDNKQMRAEMTLLSGKTLGILGLGLIGEHLARAGRGFGMSVIGCRRSGEPSGLAERVYGIEEIHEFLGQCDIVVNVLPLTEATRGLVGPRELAAMKPGAILVNGGRGPTTRTDAMVEALQRGHLSALILDVCDPEPLPPDHPLWTMENVYISPHVGGLHPDYECQVLEVFLDNVHRYLNGEPLRNVVNLEAGY